MLILAAEFAHLNPAKALLLPVGESLFVEMSLREVASICRSSALVRLLLLTLVDCMKRILKPVGHCLTTIAMTSAMLEAYPAAVEAATPRPPRSDRIGSHNALTGSSSGR